MLENQERRSPNAARVHVDSRVEICGQEPESSAFEAQSINVSSRGMQLRTHFVPEQGQSLVCRFESHGRQIVVEGQVIWRRDAAEGDGEFGVQFTALDGSSVDALKALCTPAALQAAEAREVSPPALLDVEPGMKVRLHIEGLAAPMKARVKGSSRRRVQVGSNLEFLKVGREIEVESGDENPNFLALIDGVEVSIDPRTQVPQLLVTLRRPGIDQTPEPAVVDTTARFSDKSLRKSVAASATDAVEAESTPGEQEEALSARELAELGQRMGKWAAKAGVLAKGAGSNLVTLSEKAAGGLGKVFEVARARMGKPATENKERLRRTAPPPEGRFSNAPPPKPGVRSVASNGLRQQSSPVVEASSAWAGMPPKMKLLGTLGVGTLLFGVTAFITLRGGNKPESAPVPVATASAVGPNAATPNVGVAPGATGKSAVAKSDPKQGIVAEVPLFGPTPMATLEAAPKAPAEAAPELAMNEGERELQLSHAAAQEDESFTEDTKQVTKPEDVKPFQRGNLELPIVYKLKLDAPGGALTGTPTPTGFKVMLAGRKVLDNGRVIEQRDRRILRVRTNNTQAGAEITFQFRGPVPGYKVRLQKDSVDFFVSSGKDK